MIPRASKALLVCGTAILGTLITVISRIAAHVAIGRLGGGSCCTSFMLGASHVDTHTAIGTNMQYSQCPAGSTNADCQAAFLGIYLTSQSSAYFEVRTTQRLGGRPWVQQLTREHGYGLQITI